MYCSVRRRLVPCNTDFMPTTNGLGNKRELHPCSSVWQQCLSPPHTALTPFAQVIQFALTGIAYQRVRSWILQFHCTL
eukprot:5253421-Amphidinium_carterae.1